MWGTKSRFVVVIISKIGWNPGNEFGKNACAQIGACLLLLSDVWLILLRFKDHASMVDFWGSVIFQRYNQNTEAMVWRKRKGITRLRRNTPD